MGGPDRQGIRRIRLLACGDVNLQHRERPAEAFDLVQEELATADLRFADLEMCLYQARDRIVDKPGWTQSDVRMIDGLLAVGIDVVSCANNVTIGAEAIASSLDVLDRHGIAHTGAGHNLTEASRPAIVERQGTRFGFLAATAVYFPHGHAAGPNAPGVHAFACHTAYQPHPRVYELPGAPAITRSWPDPEDMHRLDAAIEELRPRVDVLVIYFHWGVSGQEELAEYQRTVGHRVIDAGADLVLGSHAHVPQAVEVYRNRVIFYGLGNFAFDWHNMARHRSGLLAECLIENRQIVHVSFKPVWRREDSLNQPEMLGLETNRGREISDRVLRLSEAIGTTPRVTGNKVMVWRA